MKAVKKAAFWVTVLVLLWVLGSRQQPFSAQSKISIEGGRWMINGQLTYPGSAAEGLLMNVRMVNAVFEDQKRSDFDPEANTEQFIQAIPDYAALGVRAFTINLQGGVPGYEEAVNSAFDADGSLRRRYMKRVQRVVEACDRQGVVVILGCFYQRQDQVLKSEAAVKIAVENVAGWIKEKGFDNVLLEIANEYGIRGFDHEIIKSDVGMASLISLAKETMPDLLVSASGLGDGRLSPKVIESSDFLLIHFNTTKVSDIPVRVAELRKFGKIIICNEDQKLGKPAVEALRLCVKNGISWGFMQLEINQSLPFEFKGREDDPEVYDELKRLTSAR